MYAEPTPSMAPLLPAATPYPLALEQALPLHWVLPTWTYETQTQLDSIYNNLHDEDVEQSDDTDFTDSSGGISPVTSPSTMPSKADNDVDSLPPIAVVPMARRTRSKRKRMSHEERKLRHREVQRQFMTRKRARLAELRKARLGVDKQTSVMAVTHTNEQGRTDHGTGALLQPLVVLSETVETVDSSTERSTTVGDLISEDTTAALMVVDFEWDDFLDILSDDITDDYKASSLWS